MALGNTPNRLTNIFLERNKSFALNVRFKYHDGTPFDLTDHVLRLSADAPKHLNGDEVITLVADHVDSVAGHAQFKFQALDTNLEPAEYAFDMTLLPPNQYSIPVTKGSIIIGQNAEELNDNTFTDNVQTNEDVVVLFGMSCDVEIRFDRVELLVGPEGDQGPPGSPTAVFIQPTQPVPDAIPPYFPLWVDTDAEYHHSGYVYEAPEPMPDMPTGVLYFDNDEVNIPPDGVGVLYVKAQSGDLVPVTRSGPPGPHGPPGVVIVDPEPPPTTGLADGSMWVDEDSSVPPYVDPSPVLILGPSETVPVGTADGTILVRMVEGSGPEVTAEVTIWIGAQPPESDTTPPAPVTALAAYDVTSSGCRLQWSNPADSDLALVVVRRADGATAPATPTAGTGVLTETGIAPYVVDTGLTQTTTYSYSVFTADSAGNINPTPATVTITTGVGVAPPAPAPVWLNTLVLDEQWATLDSTRWGAESSTYGSEGNRVQRYRPENLVVGPGSSGSSGNSLKMVSKREFYIDRDFTAGMIGSRSGSTPTYYPRYGRYEFRHKIPHGQGIWPAAWLRHRNGASICEVDVMEYFESQVPGRLSVNLHRTPSSGAALVRNLHNRNAVFETPDVSYQTTGNTFHTSTVDIIPWTAATVAGGTYGDPGQPSANVLFRFFLDGMLMTEYVDTSAYYWTSLYADDAFDICLQGSQIGGTWNGHPDDPAGYSRWLAGGKCIISGTAPNSCTVVRNGRTNLAPVFPSTYEIDYVRVYRYDGSGIPTGTPLKNNNAEGGTDATNVSAGNSGGASGDAFTVVTTGALSYTATSPLVGSKSFTINGAAASTGASVGWIAATLGSLPVVYGRMYIKMSAWPTGGTGLVAMGKDADAGATTWRIGIGTGGALRFGIATFTLDAAPVLALDTTYRLEWMVNSLTGAAEIKAYTLAGALHCSATTTFTPTNPTQWAAFGRVSTGSGAFLSTFDEVAIGSAGWMGAAV